MATTISGKQKAAMVMRLLDRDQAARLLHYLPETELMALTAEVMKAATPATSVPGVLEEFNKLLAAPPMPVCPGPQLVRELLENAFGASRATDLMDRLAGVDAQARFAALRRLSPRFLLPLLQHEHPQIVALLLTYVTPEQGAELLRSLDDDARLDVSTRLARLDQVSPEALQELERLLEERLAPLLSPGSEQGLNGIQSLAGALNALDNEAANLLLDGMNQNDPEMVDRVRRAMFTFEDLNTLDDRAIQRILREVESRQLALALKRASAGLKEKVFKNMSARAAQALKDDLEIMGPTRVKDIEEAQGQVLEAVRRLEESKEIVIGRGGGGDVVA